MDQRPDHDQSTSEATSFLTDSPSGMMVDPRKPTEHGAGRRRGLASLAWIGITILVVIVIALRNMPQSDEAVAEGSDINATLMEMQAKYLVGVASADAAGSTAASFDLVAASLDLGSMMQRQRFVVLAADVVGPWRAVEALDEIEVDIAEARDDPDYEYELTEAEATVLDILNTLYRAPDGGPAESPRIDALTDDERQLLVDELGWLGRLALNPAGADGPGERKTLVASGQTVMLSVLAGFGLAGLGGLTGLVLLIIFVVLALTARLRNGLQRDGGPSAHHGVYAETFAVWLTLFFGLQFGMSLLPAEVVREHTMMLSLAAFALSLIAIAWPLMRGVSFVRMKRDIGWHTGAGAAAEFGVGLVGYLGALPMLAVGIAITFVLMVIQGGFAEAPKPFMPGGGPAHPIISELSNIDFWSFLQVLVVASIAAPVVEETMFRGVLYRHLRDATGRWGLVLSALCSGLLTSFIFAIIHPQGWVATPALMSLALAFTIVREWRGSLLPPMVMHGVSNGIVLSMVTLVLNV